MTVTKPVSLTATEPFSVAVPDHVYPALKLDICTVKPVAVAVGVPNVGVSVAIAYRTITTPLPPVPPVRPKDALDAAPVPPFPEFEGCAEGVTSALSVPPVPPVP